MLHKGKAGRRVLRSFWKGLSGTIFNGTNTICSEPRFIKTKINLSYKCKFCFATFRLTTKLLSSQRVPATIINSTFDAFPVWKNSHSRQICWRIHFEAQVLFSLHRICLKATIFKLLVTWIKKIHHVTSFKWWYISCSAMIPSSKTPG